MHFCDVYILKGSKNTVGSNSICPQLPELGLTVVDQQVSLQRKWGPEQSFAFVTLKWSLLRVSLQKEDGVSRRMSSSLQNADGILLLLYSFTTEEGKHTHMHSQEEHRFCQILKFLRNSIKCKGNCYSYLKLLM